MNVLVTGASGFIGGNLVQAIAKKKPEWRLIAMVRDTSNPCGFDNSGIKCEKRRGDLTDKQSLRAALKGVDLLYHCAAFFTLEMGRASELERINVDGTRNILEAAFDEGVHKTIYTSTGATIGIPHLRSAVADESIQFNKFKTANDYTMSKHRAEQVALAFAGRGMNLTILNPVAPVGKGDLKPSPTGQFIIRYLKRRIRYYMDGVSHFVHVDDVVDGHIKAFANGRPGQRYLLGSNNFLMSDIFQLLEEATGISARNIIRLPYSACLAAGYAIDAMQAVTGYKSTLGSKVVHYARSTPKYSFSKAINELGSTQTPLLQAFREAKEWFHAHGALR